jgi:hypothetical protein
MTAKQHYLNNSRYVAGQNTKNAASNKISFDGTWRGAEADSFRLKQAQMQQLQQSGTGSRTDWAAKYLK